MGCTTSIPLSSTWADAPHFVIGAGCMFLNETHTLAGIHAPRRNHEVRICGFGGKKKGDEPWWQTAFRETIEELFHPTTIPTIPNTLYDALKSLEPSRILTNDDPAYITLVYSFVQLKKFLAICASHIPASPLYTRMPLSAEEVVFRRRVGSLEGVGITDVVFWPLGNSQRRFRVSKDFMTDMRSVVH